MVRAMKARLADTPQIRGDPAGGELSYPRCSIVVPLHRDGPRFRYALQRCVEVAAGASAQIIVVSDHEIGALPPEVVRVMTGCVGDTPPGVKRDRALRVADGDLVAFIDDDAYPDEGWLINAFAVLEDKSISGVGGPGLTPDLSTWRERLGGAVYESWLGSGPLRHRFRATGVRRSMGEIPAFNFVVRRKDLIEVGGWGSSFYGGEDTKLCEELTRRGKRLVYEPDMVVYHYRRAMFRPHMRQVANIGRHRGFFFRTNPLTSRRIIFLLPSTVVVGVLGLALWGTVWRPALTLSALGMGWAMLTLSGWRRCGASAVLFPLALGAHHLSYGWNFIRGLLTRQLDC